MSETGGRARKLVHRLSRLGQGSPVAAPEPIDPGLAGFNHRDYAADNADIADAIGVDDAARLKAHFDKYGRGEGRGVPVGDYFQVESLVVSDGGALFLSGWADRRLLPALRIQLELGYVRHDLGDVAFCWLPRADVSQQTGDGQNRAGFVALLVLPGLVPHARLRLWVNGQVAWRDDTMRWLSADRFLTRALGGLAPLADQPLAAGLDAAETLAAPLATLWQGFLEQIRYTLAFEHAPARPVTTSIVIALYREADMLLPQLATLAGHLSGSGIEVIVVANALQNAQRCADQLRGFCQIHDVALRLYLCSDNSGFSAANNFGAEQARGEVLVFMNPDIFPPEHAPEAGLGFLDTDPGEALVGALLYYGDGLLMHSGMYVAADQSIDARAALSAPALRVEHFGKGLGLRVTDGPEATEAALAPIRDTRLLVTAALWKIRKTAFVAAGGLSTDYLFAYYEDADFCMRWLEAGREIRLDETARWIHMEGVGKSRPTQMRAFMWLNRVLFTRRFAGSELIASADTDLHQL
jgi:GT2 family glycosyltransferase